MSLPIRGSGGRRPHPSPRAAWDPCFSGVALALCAGREPVGEAAASWLPFGAGTQISPYFLLQPLATQSRERGKGVGSG